MMNWLAEVGVAGSGVSWAGILVGSSFGAVAVAIVQGFFQRRKIGADYADVVTRSATSWVSEQERRIGRAEERAGRAEDRAEHAERSAERCQSRMRQLEDVLRAHDIDVPPPAVTVE